MPGTHLISQSWSRPSRAAVLIASSLFSVAVAAQDLLQVSNARVTPTRPGQSVAGAYMQLRSANGVSLVRIDSAAAARVEIHQMSMDGDIMRMRRLERLDLPAGETVELAPGGRHLMLLDVRRPLQPGDTVKFELKLRLADGAEVEQTVIAQVAQPRGARR